MLPLDMSPQIVCFPIYPQVSIGHSTIECPPCLHDALKAYYDKGLCLNEKLSNNVFVYCVSCCMVPPEDAKLKACDKKEYV